jgi:hypothetical protein
MTRSVLVLDHLRVQRDMSRILSEQRSCKAAWKALRGRSKIERYVLADQFQMLCAEHEKLARTAAIVDLALIMRAAS